MMNVCDYERIAAAMNAAKPRNRVTSTGKAMYVQWRLSVACLADALKADNAEFVTDTFNAACGVEAN